MRAKTEKKDRKMVCRPNVSEEENNKGSEFKNDRENSVGRERSPHTERGSV